MNFVGMAREELEELRRLEVESRRIATDISEVSGNEIMTKEETEASVVTVMDILDEILSMAEVDNALSVTRFDAWVDLIVKEIEKEGRKKM
jgi:hypothetical protein